MCLLPEAAVASLDGYSLVFTSACVSCKQLCSNSSNLRPLEVGPK